MSQYDFSNIDPDLTSGTALATLLNSWREAIKTNHAGAARPSYAVAGMIWVKTVSATAHEIYYYDGADDILLATVNPTANTIAYASLNVTGNATIGDAAGDSHTFTGAITHLSGTLGHGTSAWPTTVVGKSGVRALIGGEGILALWNETAGAGNAATLYLGAKHASVATAMGAIRLQGGTEGSDYASFATLATMNGAGTMTDRLRVDSAGVVRPAADNTQTLGSASYRWSTVYAGTGTINTSDARTKQDIRDLAAQEIAAARQLAAEVGTYRFIAAVEAKGAAARQHIGLTVQRAIQIMEAHGLDPLAYGFICFDAWAERAIEHPAQSHEEETGLFDAQGRPALRTVIDAEAWTETIPAGDTYGFRSDELLLFIARGLAAGQADLEARVAALESAA